MDTKSKIIIAATELFQQKGYLGVSINDILDTCNISKGSLYHHFPNGKEELLIACLEKMSLEIEEDIIAIFNKYPTANGAVQAMLEKLIIDFETEGTITGYTFTSIVSEMGSLSETIREACSNLYVKIEKIYSEKLVTEGVPLDKAKEIALMMTATIEGAIMLTLTKRTSKPLKTISQVLIKTDFNRIEGDFK